MIKTHGDQCQPIKNRSSKHLFPLTKFKGSVRSMNNEQLAKLYTDVEVSKEIRRRNSKKR